MAIRQQVSGIVANGGTGFTVTFGQATLATSRIVVAFASNNVVGTLPTNFVSRAPQVNTMGHYLIDGPGGSNGYVFAHGTGHSGWHAYEVENGAYLNALGQNSTGSGSNVVYSTPALTPTAGTVQLIGSVAHVYAAGTHSLAGWTNSFVEQFDTTSTNTTSEWIAHGSAIREVTADGATAYSTGAASSTGSFANSAIIGAYSTSGAAPTAPTVSAGADVADHINGTLFTRTATENANNGTISARAWTVQSGPAQVGATIGTAAALSWTPATAGTYVLRYSATNEAGTGTDDMTLVAVAAQVLTPLSVVSSTGVTVTGAADIIAALDNPDTTGYAALDGGETLEVLLDPGTTPAVRTGHNFDYILPQVAGTATVSLVEGTTVRASETRTAAGTYTLTLSEAQASAITNYSDLRLRFTVA